MQYDYEYCVSYLGLSRSIFYGFSYYFCLFPLRRFKIESFKSIASFLLIIHGILHSLVTVVKVECVFSPNNVLVSRATISVYKDQKIRIVLYRIGPYCASAHDQSAMFLQPSWWHSLLRVAARMHARTHALTQTHFLHVCPGSAYLHSSIQSEPLILHHE